VQRIATSEPRRRLRWHVAIALSVLVHGSAAVALLTVDRPTTTEEFVVVSFVEEQLETEIAVVDAAPDPAPAAVAMAEPGPDTALREPPLIDEFKEVPLAPDDPQSPAIEETRPSSPGFPSPDLPSVAPAESLPPPLPQEPEPAPAATESEAANQPQAAAPYVPLDPVAAMPARPLVNVEPEVVPPPEKSKPEPRMKRTRKSVVAAGEPTQPTRPRRDTPDPLESPSGDETADEHHKSEVRKSEPERLEAPSATVDDARPEDRPVVAQVSTPTVSAGLSDAYRRSLVRWLERRKSYPPAARRARAEGRVVLRIVIARDGTVLGASIVSSSGHQALDEAALLLVERAGTAPAAGPESTADRIILDVPLSYAPK